MVLAGAAASGRGLALGCGVGADFLPVVYRELRALDLRHRMIFQFLQRHLDALFQLRIAALAPLCGIEFHFDVRRNALIFYVEFASFWIVQTPAWSRESAA